QVAVIEWQKSLGGSNTDWAYSIQQTTDGGYIVAGWSQSNDGDVTGNHGGGDYWVVKLDVSGNISWQKSLGGSNTDWAYSIQQTTDGGYIVAGYSESNDGDVTGNHGTSDYWIVKLDVANIAGTVYFDSDLNCVQDTNEYGIEGINLVINPGNIVVSTNYEGEWWIDSLPIGTYTVTIDSTTSWFITCPLTQSFTVTNPNLFTPGPSFGILNNNPCSEPDVSIHMPFMRPCFTDQKIYVSACNQNTATGIMTAAYVDVELDSMITLNSATLAYTSLGNYTYRFQLGDLNPGQCVDFNISATVSCSAVLGQTLCMKANLYPVDPCVLDTIPSVITGVTPCTLPWDNSSLQVEGWCQNDTVYFSITNTGDFGNGDMDCYSPVFVYMNDTLVMIDSVLLQGQQTSYYSFAANGETWILNAEQHPLHPGNSHPNAHVELCGSDTTGWIPGSVNNLPLDDADPVVDIYCGVVTGSYDPNDKNGFPKGITDDHIIRPNQQLQYT
ncbi:MAG TPA: hypothetical protein EYN51_03310, partial [Flavobacteriales bacterium]|nr:hypothetical protein [Flavobacteriales bacterium]